MAHAAAAKQTPPPDAEEKEAGKLVTRVKDVLSGADVFRDVIEQYLHGSKITFDMLRADLEALMTQNHRVRQCRKDSLVAVMMFAAKRHLTFGAYGVHIVPRGQKGSKGDVATPQIDYRAKKQKLEDLKGMVDIRVEIVYEADDFTLIKGLHPDLQHTPTTDSEKRTEEDIIGAYYVSDFLGGRQRFDFIDIATIKKHEASSSAQSSPDRPWIKWREKMIKKTVIHIAANDMLGDFTGGADTPELDFEGDQAAIEGEFEDLGPVEEGAGQPQSNAMAEELAAKKAVQGGAQAPAQEIVVPVLSERVLQAVHAKEGNPVKTAFEALREAYNNLGENENALAEICARSGSIWVSRASDEQLQDMTLVKAHFFARAAKEGMVQPE